MWEREWGKYCFFSGKSTNSEAAGILLSPNLSCEILDHIELVSGWLQALEIKIQEKLVTILNIYGPNKDEIDIFEILELYISIHEDKNVIIRGDFNTVLDIHLDNLVRMCIVCIANNINRNVYMYQIHAFFRLLVRHECCYSCL